MLSWLKLGGSVLLRGLDALNAWFARDRREADEEHGALREREKRRAVEDEVEDAMDSVRPVGRSELSRRLREPRD